MTSENRNIFLIIGALALIAIAYYIFIGRSDKETKPEDVASSNLPIPQPEPQFNAGEDVYIPPLRQGYLYIYSYPQNNQTAEIGRTTNLLNGTTPLGKFISFTNDGRFVKVYINGKTIQKKVVDPSRPASFSYANMPATGEFYVLSEFVKNKL